MRQPVRVKVCGITRVEDALCAADHGAEAVGMIFAAGSPRRVSLDHAAAIVAALPPFVTPVGVFVDPAREDVLTALRETGIRALQFHGNERPEEMMGYSVPVVKAFHVGPGFDPRRMRSYRVAAYLLDNRTRQAPGGTGMAFDWSLAAGANEHGHIILAGGLTPENVLEAIRTVHPYAVDINSGVEQAPGIKDHARIRLLFTRLHARRPEEQC
jgi:phosphoribosylanthranilate isomerase